jgi:hypothetical protein
MAYDDYMPYSQQYWLTFKRRITLEKLIITKRRKIRLYENIKVILLLERHKGQQQREMRLLKLCGMTTKLGKEP